MNPGYSYDTVRSNINQLLQSGYSKEVARNKAIQFARTIFFKKFPHGALPLYLTYGTMRLRENYTRNGEPITRDMFADDEKQNKTSCKID